MDSRFCRNDGFFVTSVRIIGLDPGLLSGAFDAGDFALGLDQGLLLALEDETRWAIRASFVAEPRWPGNRGAAAAAALRRC